MLHFLLVPKEGRLTTDCFLKKQKTTALPPRVVYYAATLEAVTFRELHSENYCCARIVERTDIYLG